MVKNLELTTSERAALVAYDKFQQKHGAPPSLRGLAALLGVYPNAARHLLLNLKEKGYLRGTDTEATPRISTRRLALSAKARRAL
jgi:DNA-binding IclR family transcriptional regulator